VKTATFARDGQRIAMRPGSQPAEAEWVAKWTAETSSWTCELDSIRYSLTVTALPLEDSLPMAAVRLEAELVAEPDGVRPVVVVAEWTELVERADEQDRLERAYTYIWSSHRWLAVIFHLAAPMTRADAQSLLTQASSLVGEGQPLAGMRAEDELIVALACPPLSLVPP
jgi:hypothetical protein